MGSFWRYAVGENGFPPDANGDALRDMAAHGDDLTAPHDIEFIVALPDQHAAHSFAEAMDAQGNAATIRREGTAPLLPWDVKVVRRMVPTHEAITKFEADLKREAHPLGGRTDGWRSFSHE